MITVLLVDDQPAVRAGLKMRLALEPDLCVVGEAGNGLEAVSLARKLEPDVVLMDIEMPGLDGISATSTLRASSPCPAVVVLTLYDSQDMRQRALEAGADAFVGKQDVCEALMGAIRDAAGNSHKSETSL
jgi:DNA-binding NarL/FixJ family response regulator